MKQLLFLLIAITFVMNGCINRQSDETAIVSGTVYSGINEVTFEWLKENPAVFKPQMYVAQVDSMGRFYISIPLKNLTLGRMLIEKKRYDIALQPSDFIEVSLTEDTITFTGNGANKNSYLHLLSNNDSCSRTNLYRTWYKTETTLEESFKIVDSYLNAKKSLYDTFNGSHNLTKEFEDYIAIERRLDEIGLYQSALVTYKRNKRLPDDSVKVPAKYQKYFSLKDLNKDEYLINNNHLNIISKMVYSYQDKIEATNPTIDSDSLHLAIAMDSLSGKTREYYLGKGIYKKLSYYDIFDSTLFAAFDSIKTDAAIISEVEKTIEKYHAKRAMIGASLHPDFLTTELRDTANNMLKFSDILEENKGKVIYIDIWSLGCGPCRMSMPFSKQIKDELQDLPVTFLYLSTEKLDKKYWQEAFEVSLTHDNHYCFERGFNSKMHELFDIMAVPTYMLIDKEGKLVAYNAERPTNYSWKLNQDLKNLLIELAS